jgi:hypothetical protein
LQISLDKGDRLRVFGIDNLEEHRRKGAFEFIKSNADFLRIVIDMLNVFQLSEPGYCPTCPAYVREWPRTYNKQVYTEWCVHDAYFTGKSGTPIMMRRYDPELEAFYLIYKRKEIPCPRLKSVNS